ncbi:molybdopterin-dependent oxidoreductase [Mucilaginibacter sp. KACC 22063]|uniref:molybdopterin-dependent oxidoreductase n=1 Tax=Mucilaginibacter sp. KACC 22063 TaxID=3025666 RepID=UPI00236601B0|nr:molybdopterin-dependent oxidoreductase [Mucilaginibacter sp. KACC 22063]WDF56926.1 molybdopterin-dependent oxidoreductase [Mucilaginibacter sp. KACC 22063]
MMKNAFLLAAALTFALSANAQTATNFGSKQNVKVGGEVEKPFTITSAWLQKAKQVSVKATGHDGKSHKYTGVLLSDIITEAGGIPNNQLRGKALARYILVKAADGYRAVIAMAEISNEFNDKQIILADKVDGKPLDDKTGPYQVIIAGEKKWGRWVREVNEIDVQTAKD